MAFTKRLPTERKGSPFARWEEVTLSSDEEREVEEQHRQEDIRLMRECLEDARKIFFEEGLKEFQSNVVDVAVALFNQRSRHVVYWKEERAKKKLDALRAREPDTGKLDAGKDR